MYTIHQWFTFFIAFVAKRYWVSLLVLLIPPFFGYIVWLRFAAITTEYQQLLTVNSHLMQQMQHSKANQEAMLAVLADLSTNEERFIALLERVANIEKRNQTLAEQQLAALMHLGRTQEVNAFINSLPMEKRPQLAAPPSFGKWLQDTHGTDQ